MPHAKSMYSRPAVSHTREPSPRSGTNGAGENTGTITSSKVWRFTVRFVMAVPFGFVRGNRFKFR